MRGPVDSIFGELALADLRSRWGAKWRRHGGEVIPAWIAEADALAAPAVVEAIESLLRTGSFTYPPDDAPDLIREAFSRRQQERHGWSPDPSAALVVTDMIQALSFAADRCTPAGAPVAMHTPGYPPFLEELAKLGRPLRPLRLGEPGDLRAAADAGVRLVVLVNPHNPTGRVWRREELQAFAEVVVERDLLVLADEIWAELIHAPGLRHVPFATLGEEVAARTTTLTSPSKSFNIAGLRCAVAHVGRAAGWEPLRAVPLSQLGQVANPAIAATLAVWSAGDEWLDAFRAAVVDRLDTFAARLAAELPECRFTRPEATYLAWVDAAALGLPAPLAAWFREHAGVALMEGTDFGPGGDGHVRVNLAAPVEVLDEMLDRMVRAVRAARG